MRFFLLCLVVLASFSAASAQDYAARFDTAWRLVDERYWDLPRLGLDWDAVRAEYEPQALEAENDAAFYRVLEAMYEELGDDHSVFVPPAEVEDIRRSYGDLPCLGVFGGVFGQASAQRLGNLSFELMGAGTGSVGYLALPDLASPDIAANLRQAVARLEGEGASAFVLDLRGNPGGRLFAMMQVAGVFTRGFLWRTLTNWTLPLPYPALGNPATDLPLVVLIDRRVNSAAEGLAGALQGSGRAMVVGETSAGNVEAVLPFCLRDGSQAWIATGVLAPIGAPTWEGRGVTPDLETTSEDALEAALAYLGRETED